MGRTVQPGAVTSVKQAEQTKQQEIPFTSARKWGALVFSDRR